jgi:hypothetical protein
MLNICKINSLSLQDVRICYCTCHIDFNCFVCFDIVYICNIFPMRHNVSRNKKSEIQKLKHTVVEQGGGDVS